jgi:hypothetical protein
MIAGRLKPDITDIFCRWVAATFCGRGNWMLEPDTTMD